MAGYVSSLACGDKPDGFILGLSCLSITKCRNHRTEVSLCPQGQVVDIPKKICADPSKVPPPCGTVKDCTKVMDGKYPDLDHQCKFFFTCYQHKFMGFNPCPANTVFDAQRDVCANPQDVLPPCGTKT